MIKFAAILLLIVVFMRWAFGRWPWDYLRGPQSRDRQLSRARHLLGVSRSADGEQIRQAHRRLAAGLHPDRGGSDARLAEINAARDLLLDALPLHGNDTSP